MKDLIFDINTFFLSTIVRGTMIREVCFITSQEISHNYFSALFSSVCSKINHLGVE